MASVADLARELRVDERELTFLSTCPAEDRARLLATIRTAAETRDREIKAAVDASLRFVPRPLRGRVVKLVRGSRG